MKIIIPTNDMSQWRWILVNSSSGKDSQTALLNVIRFCDEKGVPRDRIVVAHQDLDHVEWPGSMDLARKQAEIHGVRFEVSRYRNIAGEEPGLLDYIRKRGKWPSSTTRFCTSEYKRSPGGRIITKLWRESQGPILQVFGFRAEESPARSKKPVFEKNNRFSTKSREVMDWLPIHEWRLGEVWKDIKESQVPYHWAYDKGMPRLSCSVCVFAPRQALLLAGKLRPELLKEYAELEKEIGHDFQHKKPIREILEALERGEEPDLKSMDGNWNM